MSLQEVTSALGKSYREWKASEKDKNGDKDDFFAAVLSEINRQVDKGERELRVKIVHIESGFVDEAEELALKRFPRFRYLDIQKGEHGFDVALEEDPAFISFSYVNKEDGMVYSRQVQDGSPVLDDDRLKASDPDLYAKVTVCMPWGESVMVPFEHLDDATIAAVQEYIYPGKPVIKLAAPRKAKAEELEDAS